MFVLCLSFLAKKLRRSRQAQSALHKLRHTAADARIISKRFANKSVIQLATIVILRNFANKNLTALTHVRRLFAIFSNRYTK